MSKRKQNIDWSAVTAEVGGLREKNTARHNRVEEAVTQLVSDLEGVVDAKALDRITKLRELLTTEHQNFDNSLLDAMNCSF